MQNTIERKAPSTFADIRLITGDQGQGKSTVGTAFAVTDYYTHLTGIVSPNGELLKAKSVAESVNRDDYLFLKKSGIHPNVLKYCRIYSDNGKSKIIQIPHNYNVISPVHIFANYHLWGVKYKLCDIAYIIENINTNLFYEAWILLDESGSTSSRRSMEAMGKLGGEFDATIRKRRAHLVVMTQYNFMTEKLIRLFARTRLNCSFDEDSQIISCEGTMKGEEVAFDIYATDYFPFFDTEELPETPQSRIDRALEIYYKTAVAR